MSGGFNHACFRQYLLALHLLTLTLHYFCSLFLPGDRDRTGPQVNVGGNRSEGGGGGAPSDDLKLWETLAVVCASLLVIVAATWICCTLSNRGGNGGGCCCMNGAKTRRGPGGSQ
jgi:hypothetical protein